MRGRAAPVAVEDLGRHGAWHFTREHVVGPELVLVFHELYEAAFGPLRTRSMARQVLTPEEFAEQMADGDVVKYVAWTPTGEPVGMAALTNRLGTVPWISPEYFEARYPEQWSRDAVWYFSFVLAHPDLRHSRFIDQLVEVGVHALVEQDAVCAYDMCAYNDDRLGLGRRAAEVFERTTGARSQRADAQYYYELDFGPGGAGQGAPGTSLSRPGPAAAGRL